MTGKELWSQYQHYTRDFTEHARTLGFGGAALCWLFKAEDFRFPGHIYVSLLFFVGYFVTDILQSITSALVIRRFTESAEKRLWESTKSIEGNIDKPKWVDAPAFVLFCVKGLFLIVGFVFVGCELLRRLGW